VKKGEVFLIKLKMKEDLRAKRAHTPFLSPNLLHYFPMKIINLLPPNLPPISSYVRWQLVNQLIHFIIN
jgi:hypothetical protein